MTRKKDESKLVTEDGAAEPGEMVRAMHDDCVNDPDGQYSTEAHTHEGQTGWWHFPSEVPERLAVAPAQLSPGLNTSDLPQTVLDELADESEAEDRRQAGIRRSLADAEGIRAAAEWNRAEMRVEVDGLPVRQPGVTEKCPDKGTCHHACENGPCYRVLNAGPLSGRYREDRWPLPIVMKTAELAVEAFNAAEAAGDIANTARLRDIARQTSRQMDTAIASAAAGATGEQPPAGMPVAPSIPPPPWERFRDPRAPRRPWDFRIDRDGAVIYKLRSGDVIRVSVDQSSGMLSIESEKSQLSVWPRSVSRIQVM
jgi:hypothetical protein